MEDQPFVSERARREQERFRRRVGFEILMELCDVGEIDRESAISIATLNPEVLGKYDSNVFTALIIAKLERSMDEAPAEDA